MSNSILFYNSLLSLKIKNEKLGNSTRRRRFKPPLSLLRPCNSFITNNNKLKLNITSNKIPTFIFQTLVSPSQSPSRSPLLCRRIPGPVDVAHAAMERRRESVCEDDDDVVSTQECVRRVVESGGGGEDDAEFTHGPWQCAIEFLSRQDEIKEQLLDPSAATVTATFSRDMPLEKMDIEGDNGMVFESYDDLDLEIYPEMLGFDAEREKRNQVYEEILDSYDETKCQNEHLEGAKADILSYRPGSWIDYFNGFKLSDYDIPSTTTLLLVGRKDSGKSSLVNRISRVLNDDKFACDRAQVFCNNYTGVGTQFLLEYMIPRSDTNICLYDTRSLSEYSSENMKMLEKWMTKGVRNGELVKRDSDSSSFKNEMKYKARHSGYRFSATRMVNFVIFVVNGLSVLKSISGHTRSKLELEMLAKTFNYPFLSFRDDKPVVVITHGDLLSLQDRARVRLHLGELLGVPPMTQIFDIPENNNHVSESEVVGMLRYSLEHADRNLPVKEAISNNVWKVYLSTSLVVLLVALLYVIITMAAHSSSSTSGSGHSQDHFLPPLKEAPFKVGLTMDWHTARMAWRRMHLM